MAPRHQSAAQRATHNREVQRAQDESLAAFLASRNQTAPPALRRQHPESGLDRDERHVRQRREDRNLGEDVLVSTALLSFISKAPSHRGIKG